MMANETSNGSIIFNNTFNGPVGAVGVNNTVNIGSQINEETFYSDVQRMDAEKLGQDPDSVKLMEEIKAEAASKNKKGVLVKLRELAEKIGSSVFVKVASTLIVNVMKENGYFPF